MTRLSRRLLFVAAGGAAAALGLPLAIGRGRIALTDFINGHEVGALAFGEYPREPAIWLEVTADDRVILTSPKSEMGQGIHTALARLVAAELGVRFEQLVVKQASSASGFTAKNLDTGGSFSSRSLFIPLRTVAAVLRDGLIAEASRSLGEGVELSGGRLRARSGAELSLGELVSAHRGPWAWPSSAPLRSLETLRAALATPTRRVEDEAKLRGAAVYGYDARVPGMRFGAVARPPRYQARLVRAAEGSAAEVAGVERIVLEDGFAGVVARSRRAAHAAVERLELEWSGGTTLDSAAVEALVRVDGEGTVVHAGDSAVPSAGERLLEAEFRTPFASHCALEPQAALVDCSGPVVRAWVSTQIPSMAIDALSEALGRSASEIVVTPTFVGGGFGRKSGHDVVVEAARLSKAAGVPVHVGWTRAEELQRDFFRPPTHHRLRAVVSEAGAIRAVEHHIASGDVALSFGANPIPGGERGAAIIGFDPGTIISLPGPYGFEQLRVTIKRVKLPIPTGSWRGLGALPNTFALESFLDDVALALGRDPLQLRLEYLSQSDEGLRLRRLLEAVRRSSTWDEPRGRALGVACASYHGTLIATVVEGARRENGLGVERVWVAVDAGVLLDENGARAQIEGGVTWGVSAALKERITFTNGLAVEDSLATYRFAEADDAPEVLIDFLSSGDVPQGLGEAPLLGLPSAIRAAGRTLGFTGLDRLPLASA